MLSPVHSIELFVLVAVLILNSFSSSFSFGDVVVLQNATATHSQQSPDCQLICGPDEMIDGIFKDQNLATNGWSVFGTAQEPGDFVDDVTAVFETNVDLNAETITISLHFNHYNPVHQLGSFRISVTADNRDTFADGKYDDGDVTANWIPLQNPTINVPPTMQFTIVDCAQVLYTSGTVPDTAVYNLTYDLPIGNVTGFRLEAIEDTSLPYFDGPGLHPSNGNFVLTEFVVHSGPPSNHGELPEFYEIKKHPPGIDPFTFRRMNNLGDVVGTHIVQSGPNVIVFTCSENIIDFGAFGQRSASGSDLNNFGSIAGTFTNDQTGEEHAYLFNNGKFSDLGALGGNHSVGWAINEQNSVVGWATLPTGEAHAFLFDGQQMIDLAPNSSLSAAYDVNNLNQIVGEFRPISGESQPVLWENGTMKTLGTLGGNSGYAYAINEIGVIVGSSATNANLHDRHGFIFLNDEMIDIGTLEDNHFISQALDINIRNEVVGISGDRAFFYSDARLVDLSELIDPRAGWILNYAWSINDAGRISGWGQFAGNQRGFILDPVYRRQLPNEINVVRGQPFVGSISDITEDDEIDFGVRRRIDDTRPLVEIELIGNTPFVNPEYIVFKLDSSVFGRSEVVQSISFFNYKNNEFELMDTRLASNNIDQLALVYVDGGRQYLDQTTGEIKTRLKFQSTSGRQRFAAFIDKAIWVVK